MRAIDVHARAQFGGSVKAGMIIRTFLAKDEKTEVTLRAPKWSDLDKMLKFINDLVDMGVEISARVFATNDRGIRVFEKSGY